MADGQPDDSCPKHIHDHFYKQLDPDLAAALSTAVGIVSDCDSFVRLAQLRAKGVPIFDEALYLTVLNRLKVLADHRDTINNLLGELVPVANIAAVFGANCAHAAAEILWQRVWLAHHFAGQAFAFTGSKYEAWCAEQSRRPTALPDISAVRTACEREALLAQAARRQRVASPERKDLDEVDLPRERWEKVFDCAQTKARRRLDEIKARSVGKGVYRVEVATLSPTEQIRMRGELEAHNARIAAKPTRARKKKTTN